MTDQESPARVHALISGRVQGVWYRQSTFEKATSLGVYGWVRNLPDGRVELLAEGSKPALEALLAWAHEGPPMATVENVETNWETHTGDFRNFRVR